MTKFDNQYFFILREKNDRLPDMTPDEDTATLDYDSEEMALGSKPFVFYNGSLDFQISNKIKPVDQPPDILFDGSNILVKDETREALLPLEIPDLVIQPAIYIDHNDEWHENYWYLTFLELFDCWDRKKSEFRPSKHDMHGVTRYCLDDELLDKTPIKERRLFKMGGTSDGFVVVHQSLAKHFKGSGAELVPVADFGVKYRAMYC